MIGLRVERHNVDELPAGRSSHGMFGRASEGAVLCIPVPFLTATTDCRPTNTNAMVASRVEAGSFAPGQDRGRRWAATASCTGGQAGRPRPWARGTADSATRPSGSVTDSVIVR